METSRRTPEARDYLKELYPPRGSECVMDELTSTYYIMGQKYGCSVSGVWKVFFPDFDSKAKAQGMLQKAQKQGLRSVASSIYNLYVYLVLLQRLQPDSAPGWCRERQATLQAKVVYLRAGWGSCKQEARS